MPSALLPHPLSQIFRCAETIPQSLTATMTSGVKHVSADTHQQKRLIKRLGRPSYVHPLNYDVPRPARSRNYVREDVASVVLHHVLLLKQPE